MHTLNTYYKDYSSLAKFVDDNKDKLFDKNSRAVMVQIFSGIIDKSLLMDISQQILGLIPWAKIIGTTTNGEIINGMISGLTIVLSFSVFQHADVEIVFAQTDDSTGCELEYLIASRLNKDQARALIMFATPNVKVSRLLNRIHTESPGLPVAGGIAGDILPSNKYFVFSHENITNCGAVGAILTGEDLKVVHHHHLGWQPIGKEMTITRAEGTRVYTIDNIPAYQVYRHYLGADEEFNISNGIEFPLIISKPDMSIARSAYFRYSDDSLAFSGEFIEGEKVRFSFGHINIILEQIESLLKNIRQQPTESIFVYSCLARLSFLQDSAQIETLPLQDIAPTAGFFTSGEFFHAHNTNQLLNNSMTTLTLSEPGANTTKHQHDADQHSNRGDDKETESADNVSTRNIETLKALTCLVNTVTMELNQKTAELQTLNEELHFASTHDALTGLYNRGYFEQHLIKLKTAAAAGIIVCDVDGLKLINDTFGHFMGDVLLQSAADILKSVSEPGDVVARIGGDEFSILLCNTSESDIENYCRRVRKALDQYNLENPVVPLSMSIGFSFLEDESTGIRMLFKDADDMMYREKLYRSRSTHSDLVQTLMRTLEARKIVTEKHSQRFQDLLVKFALYIGISKSNLSELRLLAHFHNIGKVGISDHVLFKPGPLTSEERKEMIRHCEIGQRIALSSADLLPISDWVLKHHEWWNGQGYPLGLKGADIPLECRMLAVVDAYDAMISDRPYRKAMSHEAALEELIRCANTQFDPDLIHSFIDLMQHQGDGFQSAAFLIPSDGSQTSMSINMDK